VTSRGPLYTAWPSLLRVVVGLYWLYFASQKWQGVGWMHGVIAPNWFPFAVGEGVVETLVAVLLILGLASRWAGILGFLLAVGLALTVAFSVHDDGFRWLYYLAVLVNAQVIASGPGPYALGRFGWVPAWLR
jgi:uncharacterized membrane protein YphA (DoxX/SURF4 family)